METAIIAAISSALPDVEIYHDYAYEEAVLPLVIVERVGGEGNLFLSSEAGGYHIRFYISVWTMDRLDAINRSKAIETAILALPNTSVLGAAVSLTDEETGKRGMGQDFVILT